MSGTVVQSEDRPSSPIRPLFKMPSAQNEASQLPSRPTAANQTGSSKWILVTAFGAALTIVIAASVSVYLLRDFAIQKRKQEMAGTSLLLAEDANQKFLTAKLLLDVLSEQARRNARTNSVSEFEKLSKSEEAYNFLKDRVGQNDLIDVATFVSHSGRVLNFTRSWPPPDIYLGDRDYFAAHKTDSKLGVFYSVPVKNRGNGKWVFYMTRRIDFANGTMAGLVLVGLSVEKFSDLYRRVCESMGENTSVTLYNTDNILMTRWPIKDELVGAQNNTSATAIAMASGIESTVVFANNPRYTENNQSQPRLVAPRRLANFPFVVAPVVPESIYLEKWWHYTVYIGGIGVLGLLFLGFATQRLLRAASERDSLLHAAEDLNFKSQQLTAQLIASQNRQILATEELKELNGSLEERITERTEALAVANQRLESYNYSVAHDLRAPLRLIISYSQLLWQRFGARMPEESKPFVDRIIDAGKNMTSQIEGLLSIASAGQKELDRRVLNLSHLAEEVAKELLLTLENQKRAKISIGPGIYANFDPGLMRLVLQNLISNAMKYSSKVEAPEIEFGLKEQSGERHYFVKDNGAGFNMEYAQKLFQPFQRQHSESEFKGIGIGLATVRTIIEHHRGKVWAESQPGAGAIFWFTLG
jgi:hypothetical protein